MINQVLKLAELYSLHTGLKLSSVSTYAANDGKWLPSLQLGNAGCTVRKATRVIRWLDENWPEELEWPREIPRPSMTKDAA